MELTRRLPIAPRVVCFGVAPRGHLLPALLLLTTLVAETTRAQERTASEPPSDFGRTFAVATPEQVGMETAGFLALTDWIENGQPILSLLVSRNGKLVYELYTSGVDREQAHYVMSVTKSIVSALVGIAIDEKLLPPPDTAVTKVLPRRLFASDEEFSRFSRLTLRQVLGMAALDAPVPPHDESAAAVQRQQAFWSAPNRVTFALEQSLLPESPGAFQYNDITPMLATGMLQYASGTSAFEFAQQHLFAPLGFRNVEWMHQDATGIDNGGYGLRLRPIDMQKFGVLFLRRGKWEGRQLIARNWVDQSFTPWISSRPGFAANYGWYWWTQGDAKWRRHEANGWRGQRIAVIPEQGLVVTMTACIADGTEDQVFGKIVNEFLPAAVHNSTGAALPPARAAQQKLEARLKDAVSWKRVGDGIEPRMVPGVAAKESRVPFADTAPAPSRVR